jgi:hypothetical protein
VTDTANPFLVARVDSTTIWSGFWIAEDIADLTSAYERGDWIDGLIGGFGTTMDALAYVFDPVGSLVASGIAWAIEQIKPVSDVLDWLAGDPDQIVAYAQTWRNIATSMSQAATDYAEAVDREIASWTGAAADAYRRLANDHCGRLSTLGMAIGLLGTFVEGAGLVVSLLRGIVRDAIATFVSILIVRAPEWIAITAGTIGIASPWVVGQIGSLVGEWATKIARLLKAMINTIRRVMPMKHQLGEAIEALGHGSQTPAAAHSDPRGSPADPAGPHGDRDSPNDPPPGVDRPATQDFAGFRRQLDEGAVLEKSRDSQIYRRDGDSETAAADFDRLCAGLPVTPYPNGTRAVRLSDGTVITLRHSSDGRTTIELFQRDPRVQVKYRYGDK